MAKRLHKPVHPGEVLWLDFLKPMGISIYKLSLETGISKQHWGRVVSGKRNITGDLALRLARYFGTSADVWMGLQSRFDLDKAQDESGREIEKRIKPLRAA